MTTANPSPATAVQEADFNPEDFAAKMKSLHVNSKQEEEKLRGIITKLVLFANGAPAPASFLQQANSVLVLSPTGWNSLVADYPEKSFRADFNRAMRHALGLLAALEEEQALYRVRCTSEHLWQVHVRSLLYLGWCAGRLLPELDGLGNKARERGLSQKAQDSKDMADRLRQHLQEISAIPSQPSKGESDEVGVDPQWIEGQVGKMVAQLESAVRACPDANSQVSLPNSILSLSPSEREAFLADCSETEKSFRTDLNRVLRRAVGLLASLQEELALYRLTSSGRHRWQMHLKNLAYLDYQAGQIMPQVEKLAEDAGLRGLSAKAEDLRGVAGRLRDQTQQISELRRQR